MDEISFAAWVDRVERECRNPPETVCGVVVKTDVVWHHIPDHRLLKMAQTELDRRLADCETKATVVHFSCVRCPES